MTVNFTYEVSLFIPVRFFNMPLNLTCTCWKHTDLFVLKCTLQAFKLRKHHVLSYQVGIEKICQIILLFSIYVNFLKAEEGAKVDY
jgi:hypothetical protein